MVMVISKKPFADSGPLRNVESTFHGRPCKTTFQPSRDMLEAIECHEVARAVEAAGIPTMTLAVVKDVVESVRPPRVAFYDGELGTVAGKPNFPEHQRRVLDEALRLIEPMDQPGIRKLVVELESQVELSRGER